VSHLHSHLSTYLGLSTFRARHRPFGIKPGDRHSHLYLIGRTGTGKSTLLRLLALQDSVNVQGLAVFDPHGDLAEVLVAQSSRHDVIYLDGAQADWHFNPLECADPSRRALLAAGLVDVFQKIWADGWGPRLEHLLRNVLFALLETPGVTLGHVPRLLTDRDFRRPLTSRLSDPIVHRFWKDEFERYSPGFRAVVIAPLQNKIGALLTDPRLRAILTAERSSFDLRTIMDEGKVLLVNLSKGQMGEGPSSLLGSLLVSHIALYGLARAAVPFEERRPFFVYLDEFHTFSTAMLATMLSELRKYRVGLVLANQYLSQLTPEVRDAVLGNVGTLISFRLGAHDAVFMEREFAPVFTATDLLNLPNHHIYLKLMIDGQVSKPFSAKTFASIREVPGFKSESGFAYAA
jgi:DNA helicase HerA-like ATPase